MREIRISSWAPPKKNLLKLTRSGRGYYDKDVRAALDAINEEVASQWRVQNSRGEWMALPPLTHPAIGVIFYMATGNGDRDNTWTTIQDALVAGGCLKDDCVKLFNGEILIGRAIQTPTGLWGARIFIEESGDFGRMLSYFRAADLENYSWLKLGKPRKAAAKPTGSLGRKAA